MSDRMASEEVGTRPLTRARVLYLDDTDERVAVQSHVAETAAYSLETVTTLDDATSALADRAKLRHVFENLFRNSVEHGHAEGSETSLQVRVGTLPDREGFFVVDDGPDIPADNDELKN